MVRKNGQREPATPQEIWSILREVSESQRETDRRMQETRELLQRQGQETDRRMQETDRQMQDTDRRMQETDRHMQETDRHMQETDRRLRKLDDLFNGQWGKLMEALVEGDLIALLRQRGIEVHHTSANHKREYGGRHWEIDILALNDRDAVAVEVKTTLKVGHVDHFLETLRNYHLVMPPDYGSNRRVYGAVAYLKADESSEVYAERQGLYVIRATGSSASITNQPGFRPRTFGRRDE